MEKAMKRVYALIMAVVIASALLPYATVQADNFSDIEYYEIAIRYDENLPESEYLSGKGYTAGAYIYNHYMVVPTTFFSIGDEKRNMLVVYDMNWGTPLEVANRKNGI